MRMMIDDFLTTLFIVKENAVIPVVLREITDICCQIKVGERSKFELLYCEFKMGRKATGTARRVNQAFDQETVKERTAQHWFQKLFCSGDERLEE